MFHILAISIILTKEKIDIKLLSKQKSCFYNCEALKAEYQSNSILQH
jgi:hypothetical protein